MSLARLAADRCLAGLWTWMIPGGSFAAHVTRRKGRGASDSNSNRSGSDAQVHQPFELADFPMKAAHPRAVCRLHPHGGREVTVPDRTVPVSLPERGMLRREFFAGLNGEGRAALASDRDMAI